MVGCAIEGFTIGQGKPINRLQATAHDILQVTNLKNACFLVKNSQAHFLKTSFTVAAISARTFTSAAANFAFSDGFFPVNPQIV